MDSYKTGNTRLINEIQSSILRSFFISKEETRELVAKEPLEDDTYFFIYWSTNSSIRPARARGYLREIVTKNIKRTYIDESSPPRWIKKYCIVLDKNINEFPVVRVSNQNRSWALIKSTPASLDIIKFLSEQKLSDIRKILSKKNVDI